MNKKAISTPLNVLLVLALAVSIVGPAAAALPGAAPQPAGAVPQVRHGARGGGDFLVSVNTGYQTSPAIAYNPTRDEYLAVWKVSHGSSVVGQLYSAQGLPQGEVFHIWKSSTSSWFPAVAYSPASQSYLVVWQNNQLQIRGQIVSADGILLDNPHTPEDERDPEVTFAIGDTGLGDQHEPIIAHNAAADEYLVVWEDHLNGNSDLYGRLVDADGFLLTDNLALITDTAEQCDPALAYNETADNYLLVWTDYREVPRKVYRLLLDATGNPADPEEALSTTSSKHPALAYNAAQNQYLVVWDEAGPSFGDDIGGQIVNADGSPAGPPLTICAGPDDQKDPFVAYNDTLHQYLVVWQDWRYREESSADIYGQRVGADGTLSEQGDFLIGSTSDEETRPVVAYSSSAFQYLVLWESNIPAYAYKIGGQRLWWPGLPLGAAMTFGASMGRQEAPGVAYNSRYHEYMVVWPDWRDGDDATDINAQRYDRDGMPLGENIRLYSQEGILSVSYTHLRAHET